MEGGGGGAFKDKKRGVGLALAFASLLFRFFFSLFSFRRPFKQEAADEEGLPGGGSIPRVDKINKSI